MTDSKRNQMTFEHRERLRVAVEHAFAGQGPALNLSPIADIEETGYKYFNDLPLKAIDPWDGSLEFSEAAIKGLAENIKSLGVLQPVLVRPRAYGRYQLISGHKRMAAVKFLASHYPDQEEWKSIRALVLDLDDEAASAAFAAANDFMLSDK